MRGAPIPVLPRVREGRLLLDVRTLLPGDERDVEAALAQALQAARSPTRESRGPRSEA